MTSKKYSLYTAIMVVIANMIGTGVFTSLGFQVFGIQSAWSIVLLWSLGGVVALTGAFCYAELSGIHTRSGGEYHFLSFLYGKPFGFMTGWISFTLGFAAPVAAVSVALGDYLTASLKIQDYSLLSFSASQVIAITVVILISLFHLFNRKLGSAFQNVFTTLKIIFIIFFIILGWVFADTSLPQFHAGGSFKSEIFSPGFAISIYFVLYAYSGWNAVAYFAGEIKKPEKNITRSILTGTILVTILYILLNLSFMLILPFREIEGQPEIGYLFAQKIFGNLWGGIFGFSISMLLISSVSSMIIAGPRVSKVMGEDYKKLSFLAQQNKDGIPQVPILIQLALTIIYIITMQFSYLITLVGFVLSLSTFMTVIGLVKYRLQHPDHKGSFKVKWLGLVSVIFILVNLWVLYYGFVYKTKESLLGIAFTLSGLIVYALVYKSSVNNHKTG